MTAESVPGLKPVQVMSVHDAIRQQLVEFIRTRHLAVGDRLPSENVLAMNLGVGRNAIREALRSLEALGLIEARAGSGWHMRRPSLDAVGHALILSLQLNARTMSDLNRIRVVLECGFLGEAMRYLQMEDLDQLEQLADEMGDPTLPPNRIYQADMLFHRVLFSRLNNAAFAGLMDVLWKIYPEVGYFRLSERVEDFPVERRLQQAQEHRLIVEALRAGDEELAVQRLRESFAGLEQWNAGAETMAE